MQYRAKTEESRILSTSTQQNVVRVSIR